MQKSQIRGCKYYSGSTLMFAITTAAIFIMAILVTINAKANSLDLPATVTYSTTPKT